jgi:imidazolonepropionase-like amidohydrolase
MQRPPVPALALLALAGGVVFAPTSLASAAEPIDGTLAITNVTVIDVAAGTPVPGQTVVVKDDAIVAVGPAGRVAAKASVPALDGTGKFLIPGLWDMHAHVADPGMPPLFLRYGVTGVRHMYSVLRGVELAPADPAKDREAPAFPRVVAARNLIDGTRTGFPDLFQRNIVFVNAPADAEGAVAEVKKRGNDFVKVHSHLDRDVYFAMAKAARAAKLPVAGHVPFALTAAEVSDAGQLTIEHLDGVAAACSKQSARHLAALADYGARKRDERDANLPWRVSKDALETFDPQKADALFARFVANGTWHTPTLVESRAKGRLGDPKALHPEVERLLPPAAKLMWHREFGADGGVNMRVLTRKYTKAELRERNELFAEELKLVAAMHKAKVKLLAGTDTPNVLVVPGLSLHEELEIFVAAGLTPAEALRTATCHPAECLKLTDTHGSVAVGKRADLVLLSKDPLADIRNATAIDVVLLGGRVAHRPANSK